MNLAELKRNAARRKGETRVDRRRALPPAAVAACWWLTPCSRAPMFATPREELAAWRYELVRWAFPELALPAMPELDGHQHAQLVAALVEPEAPGWTISDRPPPLFSPPLGRLQVRFDLQQTIREARRAFADVKARGLLPDAPTAAAFLKWFTAQQEEQHCRAPRGLAGQHNRRFSWREVEALVRARLEPASPHNLSGVERTLRHNGRRHAEQFRPHVEAALALAAKTRRRFRIPTAPSLLALRLDAKT